MMNQSIITVATHTMSDRVKELTLQLLANAGKRCRATFLKKNGETRVMDFVPRNQYNETMGITSTETGKKMVRSKSLLDMVTVCEIVGNTFRPRTLNLRSVVGNIVPLAL